VIRRDRPVRRKRVAGKAKRRVLHGTDDPNISHRRCKCARGPSVFRRAARRPLQLSHSAHPSPKTCRIPGRILSASDGPIHCLVGRVDLARQVAAGSWFLTTRGRFGDVCLSTRVKLLTSCGVSLGRHDIGAKVVWSNTDGVRQDCQ
jgi:hypothetical protein